MFLLLMMIILSASLNKRESVFFQLILMCHFFLCDLVYCTTLWHFESQETAYWHSDI